MVQLRERHFNWACTPIFAFFPTAKEGCLVCVEIQLFCFLVYFADINGAEIYVDCVLTVRIELNFFIEKLIEDFAPESRRKRIEPEDSITLTTMCP